MSELPIDARLPAIASAVAGAGTVVVQAAPGAGKTTRVPLHLWRAGAVSGEVLVLEPRRMAARLAGRYVAALAGEQVGGTVGYQVRFEDVTSARTRVRFVTEALLLRLLLDDPGLARFSAVVFDEFHERHLAADLGFALVRRLKATTRPDLALVVMSATLETTPLVRALEGAAVFDVPGRAFPVDVEHLAQPDDRPLAAQVASALRRVVARGLDGDVLVFLPGAAEIRRAAEACEPVASASGLALVPLHGDLPPAEQDRAVRPGPERKVILSTNVAETSVTIEGVTTVIDGGLARVPGYDPWSGMPTLRVRPVSRASAIQRAGRAGRTSPGRALRLYTRHDFDTRPAFDTPEIQRAELSELALTVAALGADPASLPWLDPPPPAALGAARELLVRLGAFSRTGSLTELGTEMARLPLHPRQARLALEAAARGAVREGCLVAALLGERDIRLSRAPARESGPSDLLALAELTREASSRGAARRLEVSPGAVQAVERARRQLERLVRAPAGPRASDPEEAVLRAVLTAFPDRVAQRAPGREDELLLSGGGRAKLSFASVVRGSPWLVAVDAELGSGGATQRLPLVQLASHIEPDWLLELPDVQDGTETTWNEDRERVEERSRLTYGALVLDESRRTDVPAERATPILRAQALARGPRAFADPDALDALLARAAFVRTLGGPDVPPVLDEAALGDVLAELCEGRRSFAELREADLLTAVTARLAPASQRLLARAAPERIELPGGRKLRVHYEGGKPPWVESYLQDFFGLAEGPRVGAGRVPLTLHLLAPSRRPVQVTTDLAGFWDRHYPGLRNALARRYPRHAWPDDPRHARPPAPKGR